MEILVIATQGDEFSYHAEAARRLAGDEIEFDPKVRFGEVVRASRMTNPGLGVIAISTVAGTVDDSAREIVRKRVSALPPIVGRVDVPIKLSLIGSGPMDEEELSARGVRLLAQKPAYLQCLPVLEKIAPQIKVKFVGESIQGVREALARNLNKSGNNKQHPYLAIGPAHAAEPLGGVIVGPEQVNPLGSITSFYALQRDPNLNLIPKDPEQTSVRTVVSLAHPDKAGEFEKAMRMTEEMGIIVSRFIPFNIGDFTKHDPNTRRGGGIFEIAHGRYDEQVTEWIARIIGLEANDGFRGPFDINMLGTFAWYEEESVDLRQLAEKREAAYSLQRKTEAEARFSKWEEYLQEII